MKKFSKLLTIITLIAMLITSVMPVSVFAAGETGSITIKAPTGHALTGTYDVYRIFELSYSPGEDGGEAAYSYTLLPAFNQFQTDYLEIVNGELNSDDEGYVETLAEYLGTLSSNVKEMNDFAAALWKYINDSAGAITSTGSFDTAADDLEADGSAKISDLPLGYYLIYGTTEYTYEDGTTATIYAACSLKNTAYDATVELKVDAPTIDKEVWNHNLEGGDGDWSDWTDLNIGDTAEFKLTTKVPQMKGYDSYQFIVHDKMSDGLSFDIESVEVKIGATTYYHGGNTESGSEGLFEIVDDHADCTYGTDCTFAIVFDPAEFIKLNPGDDIIITYSALVNDEANIGVPGNPNAVYLEYSNDADFDGEGDTSETPEDEVIVYTFELDVYKYTGDISTDGDTALAGAEFSLTSDGNKVLFVLEEGVYRVALPEEIDAYEASMVNGYGETIQDIVTVYDIVVSSDTGSIKIIGLDAGTYILEEINAPEGYNKLEDTITVIITFTEDGEDSDYGVTYKFTNDTTPITATPEILVENKTGIKLPETGGIGRTIFILVGATMIGLGLISLVVFRKKIFGSK